MADAGISPLTVEFLLHLGHEAVHVRTLGMHRASDSEIVQHARSDSRIILTFDLDLRWIPRNYVFGFRVAATLADDSVWYDANARFGRHTFLLGLFMVVLEFILPIAIRNQVLATVAIVTLPGLVVANWRTANRWRRERDTVLNH